MIESAMIDPTTIESVVAEYLPALVSNLGWALVHFLWQGVLVGLVAALFLTLLRHAQPQKRYAVA